jgi:ATP-dependent exoDNAse (exonuclease V) beta subunit
MPPPRYEDEQWQLLRHLFVTLRYAVAELNVVFAEQNQSDFVELGISAETVLKVPDDHLGDAPSDLSLALSDRVRHLLVDEFQDTSRQQLRLLSALVRGWDSGDGRTCFLVGDPMQSIYLFRQAEVELFAQLQKHGLASEGPLVEFETLQLTTNFRSGPGIVVPLNDMFVKVFGEPAEPSAVRFAPSIASDSTPSNWAVHVHPDFVRKGAPDLPSERTAARGARPSGWSRSSKVIFPWPLLPRSRERSTPSPSWCGRRIIST